MKTVTYLMKSTTTIGLLAVLLTIVCPAYTFAQGQQNPAPKVAKSPVDTLTKRYRVSKPDSLRRRASMSRIDTVKG